MLGTGREFGYVNWEVALGRPDHPAFPCAQPRWIRNHNPPTPVSPRCRRLQRRPI